MSERIILLRKHLKLTQTEFGEKLGLSRSAIANLELGRVSPTELVVRHIASTFHVSEDWLRTGGGEMFVETDDSAFSAFVAAHGLDEADAAIMRAFVGLPPASRAALHDFVRRAADLLPGQSDLDVADRAITERLQNQE